MIKLLAIDMDGTLLNSDKKIPKDNITAIQKAVEKGVQVVICTGRAQSGVEPYFAELGLSGEDDYAILNNGCSVHKTSDWSLVDYAKLTSDELVFQTDLVKKYSDIQLVWTSEDKILVADEEPSDLVVYDAGLVFATPQTMATKEAIDDNTLIFQAMFMGEKPVLDIFQKEAEEILAERFSVVRSQSYIFEAMPKGVTKASALKKLAEKLGVDSSEIMALGDAENDLEMLTYAGLGVAMGNASDEIKSLCKAVTASNNDAGVARAIEKFILED